MTETLVTEDTIAALERTGDALSRLAELAASCQALAAVIDKQATQDEGENDG